MPPTLSIADAVAAASEGLDSRATAVALAAIALSFLGGPTLVHLLRWMAAWFRLGVFLIGGGTTVGTVSDLYVHPVKSMRATRLEESALDRKGLENDRRFMVVYERPLPAHKTEWGKTDTTHRFLTQRQCPSLATISTAIDTVRTDDGKAERVLVLEQATVAPSSSAPKVSVRVPLARLDGKPETTYLAGIWDDVVAVEDLGERAAAFLQAIADADEELAASFEGGGRRPVVRLVRESLSPLSSLGLLKGGPETRAYVPAYAKAWHGGALGKPTLTDGFPVLIASEASLDVVNQRLVHKGGHKPISMSQFRPNIVIKRGSIEPFEEDRWKVVAIGNVVFAIVKACPRCKQSCTDQTTGTVSKAMEPLETMKAFRRAFGSAPKNGSVFFGQNAIPIGRLEGKTIKVGDPVRVLERGDPVYID
ncbi:unnamed protein product [Pseudo-nitzschia multistriata]|uniref:MOSC domain-containing protein n=1 Tax=Pseudo-nitzschia multistriata TaxID=183589 RepID=A0A448ZH18_9STRA|nr:unnamed protein product [Pseudo-nitzschia multistriata]